MPVNAGPEYAKAERKYIDARTPMEKLAALQEMKSTVPKHKGTENLLKEIVRKISRIKAEMVKQKEMAAKRGSGRSAMSVRKEGCGQIVLAGLPNSGKSTALHALTGIDVEIAPHPYTTVKPEVGMFDFGGARIQLVELPAVVEGSADGKAQGNQVLSAVRNSDAIVLVVDAESARKEAQLLEKELKKAEIWLNQAPPKIQIKKSSFPGLSITGKEHLKISEKNLLEFLRSAGYPQASVTLEEDADLGKIAQALDEKICYKKALVLANKSEGMEKIVVPNFRVVQVSDWNSAHALEEVKSALFALLGVVRVYTKRPGQEPDYQEPLVAKKGSTVEQVAKHLHKELVRSLKFVRVWGSTKFEGQRVSKDYVLHDQDIIEIN
ncbi:MAG: GTPase [Candidatus Diapherotrites archaeon]